MPPIRRRLSAFAACAVAWAVAPRAEAAPRSAERLVRTTGAIDAAWLPLPQGPPAIVVTPTDAGAGAVTLLADPDARRWRAVPSPGDAVVAAADGLHSMVAAPGHPWAGRRWRLDHGRWVPDAPLPPALGPGAPQAVAVAADGVATVWTSAGGWLQRHQAQAAGWASATVGRARAWSDDGVVYWQDATSVQRDGARWPSPAMPTAAQQVFDEGPAEQPLFVAVGDAGVELWYAGEAHTQRLETSRSPALTDCVAAPCPFRRVHHAVPGLGRLAFDAHGPVVPVLTTIDAGTKLCTAGPEHPCSRPDALQSCAHQAPMECAEDSERVTLLRLLRRRPHGWDLQPVGPPFAPSAVLDTQVQGDAVNLLVSVRGDRRDDHRAPASPAGLYRLRIDAEGPDWTVSWPSAAHAPDLDPETVLTAGFLPFMGASPTVPPARWIDGALETGGVEVAAGLGHLLHDSPPPTLSVTADIEPWHTACGQPEIALQWGGQTWTLELGATPAVLRSPRGAAVALPVPGDGAHTWAIARERDRVTVLRDSVAVHTQPVAGPVGGAAGRTAWASFGQRASCGRRVGPASRRAAASVTPTEPMTRPDR